MSILDRKGTYLIMFHNLDLYFPNFTEIHPKIILRDASLNRNDFRLNKTNQKPERHLEDDLDYIPINENPLRDRFSQFNVDRIDRRDRSSRSAGIVVTKSPRHEKPSLETFLVVACLRKNCNASGFSGNSLAGRTRDRHVIKRRSDVDGFHTRTRAL